MNESRAGILIRQIHVALEKETNKKLAEDDLTLSQVGLLVELGEADNGTLTYKELEKKLGLAQSTTVGLISRLEKKKMIKTHTDPSDGRIKYAVLTEAGMACCGKADRCMKEQEEILLRQLDTQERTQLVDYLQRVKEALTK